MPPPLPTTPPSPSPSEIRDRIQDLLARIPEEGFQPLALALKNEVKFRLPNHGYQHETQAVFAELDQALRLYFQD